MEEKTINNTRTPQFSNLISPFEEPTSQSSMEMEQASVEANADEPFWLKILCFLGFIYPNLRENGKCNCNCKTILWSILPFIWTCIILLEIILIIMSHSSIFRKVMQILSWLLFFSLQLSLSYTRKKFKDAIVGIENIFYVNKVAKRGIVLSAIVVGVISGVIAIVGENSGVIQGVINGVMYTIFLFQFTVIIIRCIYLTHTSVTQPKNKLMDMVKRINVEGLQTNLLEISKKIQKASSEYLQVPLSLIFLFSFMQLVDSGISLYKHQDYSNIVFIIIIGIAIVAPLWLLTRIEKFYLWTLRELLHRNTVMPQIEQTNLLSKYDTIAPRASIFGIYITRGLVASIIIAILGAIIPKIGMYWYENS